MKNWLADLFVMEISKRSRGVKYRIVFAKASCVISVSRSVISVHMELSDSGLYRSVRILFSALVFY